MTIIITVIPGAPGSVPGDPLPTAPTATNDPGLNAVTAGPQVLFDLAANDSFLGAKANLTFGFNVTGTQGSGIAKHASGLVTYTPHASFAGNDTFQYRITDQTGNVSNWATATVACSGDDYSVAVQAAGAAGPLAYWRMASTASIVDEEAGARHGTYSATPQAAAALPNQSNASVRLPGTVTGTIPHSAGLLLPAFTLSLWVKIEAFPGGSNAVILSRGASGSNFGDFTLYVLTDGTLRVRFEAADGNHNDLDWLGFQLNTTYHIAVTAGTGGVSLWVNGKFRGLDQGHTAAWTSTITPIVLATASFTAQITTMIIDEIALYPEVLSDANIVTLSQVTATPTAVPGSMAVDEGASSTSPLIDSCSFIGRKSSLTVGFIQGTRGTASVNASKDLVYTANADEGGQTDSFQYRITDLNGVSSYATVSVTIQDVGAPAGGELPDDLVNHYPASGTSSVVVSSMNDLITQVNAAPAGRHILIAAGTYTGGTRTFSCAGTAANPIVIRPQGARGSVTITGARWSVPSSTTRLVFANLYFSDGRFTTWDGPHNRLTRCRFRQVTGQTIQLNALNTRFDHLDVADYVNNGLEKQFLRPSQSGLIGGSCRGIAWDHNYFHEYGGPYAAGIDDSIYTSGSTWATDPELYFLKNLYRNLQNRNRPIGNKWSMMRIRYCTFENCNVYLEQRQGGGQEIRSSWFENAGTIRAFDDTGAGFPGQLIIGNRFIGGNVWIGCGNGSAAGPDFYHASINGDFIGNIMDGSATVTVGAMWSVQSRVVRASGNLLAGNTRGGNPMSTSNGIILDFQQNTTIQTSIPAEFQGFTPAVKLTPTDVGMAAADPYDPTGPQS